MWKFLSNTAYEVAQVFGGMLWSVISLVVGLIVIVVYFVIMSSIEDSKDIPKWVKVVIFASLIMSFVFVVKKCGMEPGPQRWQ